MTNRTAQPYTGDNAGEKERTDARAHLLLERVLPALDPDPSVSPVVGADALRSLCIPRESDIHAPASAPVGIVPGSMFEAMEPGNANARVWLREHPEDERTACPPPSASSPSTSAASTRRDATRTAALRWLDGAVR